MSSLPTNLAWPSTRWPAQGSGMVPTLRLWSTVENSTFNYEPYLYDYPVKKDILNTPDLLDFALVPADDNFVKLDRGAYIQFDTVTYGTWFTGFVTSYPNLELLGSQTVNGVQQGVYGYRYEATGEDYLLNLKPLPIIGPFINMTQGQILKTLVGVLAPEWNFDTSNIADGMLLARYIVDPTQHFTDVVQAFCKAACYRFTCRSGVLKYQAQDVMPANLVIDGSNPDFTPINLSLSPSNDPIVNDSVVLGDIEPQNYMAEYFIGDSWTASFPLVESCYGTDTTLLFDESFPGSTIDTQQKWDVFDTGQWIQVAQGFCNALGGNNNNSYDVWMQTQYLFPLEGALRITHGEYDFVQNSSGIICSLWTAEPTGMTGFNAPGCLYGIWVSKSGNETYSGINPIANGAVDLSQGADINFNYRYVIRTNFSFTRSKRFTQAYAYLDANGNVQTLTNPTLPDTMTAQTWIVQIDPDTGTVIKQANGSYAFASWTNTIPLTQDEGYAFYAPVVLNDLHCSFTGMTISTPLQATLYTREPQSSVVETDVNWIQQLIGPNEMDSYDGFTPVATVVDANQGATTRSSMLGRIQYNPGQAALTFFSDSVTQENETPGVGEMIQFRYRSAGSAIGRVQDKSSVATEAEEWGDNGLRSQVTQNLNPLPRTSTECEVAAQAIVNDQSRQHWDGTYQLTNLYEATGEITSGTILKFQNMPDQYPTTLTNEVIKEVDTTFSSKSPVEVFDITVTFQRFKTQDQLASLFTKPVQPWQPTDDAQVPSAIDITSVGTVFADDITTAAWSSFDTNFYYYAITQAPPTGGGFEVRYTDESWGCDPGKNLIVRTAGSTFQVPRNLRGQMVWIRAYDGRNICLFSEDFTAGVWQQGNGLIPVSNSMGVNPDGITSIISTLTMNPAQYVQQVVHGAPLATGTEMVFSVSVKAATMNDVGKTVFLQIQDDVSPWSSRSSLNVTLTADWERYSISFTATAGNSGYLVSISNNGPTPAAVQMTRGSFETGTLTETVYCKTTSIPYGALSRYSAGLHVALPLIPNAPTAFVDTSKITELTITVTLPNVANDVWGYEIRASDNKTVLTHQDIIDAVSSDIITNSYQFQVTGNKSRNPTFYVYVYNLLGEYSPAYTAVGNVPNPTVASLAADDINKKLTWTGTNATSYLVELDDTSFQFKHVVRSVSTPDTHYAFADPDFFYARWIQVTPFDILGKGTSVTLFHNYDATAVIDISAAEVLNVPAPATPTTDPTVPAGFSGNTEQIIALAWQQYAANKDRYL